VATRPEGPLQGQQGLQSRSPESRMSVKRRRDYTAELLTEGKTYRQIAAATGVSVATAWKDIQVILAQGPPVDLAEQRAMALSRLDSMEERLRDRLNDFEHELFNAEGDTVEVKGSIERTMQELLRVEERRAKLLGLDAPVRTEVDASVQVNYRINGADGV